MSCFTARIAVAFLLAGFFCCAALQSQEPKVPGLLELVVYKPGVHDRGLPQAIFKDYQNQQRADGEVVQEIEIPPTVHVHRYYYSGDKEYQGPIVNGGPTLVVAKHPETGRQMYVDVVLPTGAPTIAYSKNTITYVYAAQRVSIKFRKFPFDPNRAVVEFHSGRGVKRRVNEHLASHKQKAIARRQQSPALEAIKSSANKTHNALKDGGQQVRSMLKTVKGGLESAIGVFPGMTPLMNPSDDGKMRQYQNKVRSAASKARRTATDYVETIR